MFERFADSGVIGKLATLSESFQGMHPVESLNYVNEIAVNQGVSTLKCALALACDACRGSGVFVLRLKFFRQFH